MTDPRIQEEQDWDKECQEAEVRVAQIEERAREILANVQPADIPEIMDYVLPYETVIASAFRDNDNAFLGNIIRRLAGMDWARDRAESDYRRKP